MKKSVVLTIALFLFSFPPTGEGFGNPAGTPPDEAPDIQRAIKKLGAPDAAVRIAAALELGNQGERALPAVPHLIALLDDATEVNLPDPDRPTSPARAATRALVKIGTPGIPSLTASLKHKNWIIRTGCAEILGDIGDQQALGPLRKTMADSNPLVRKQAAVAVGKISPGCLVDTLNHKKARIRAAAARALGERASGEAVRPLISALEDNDITVKGSVIEALGQLRNTRATPYLLELLKHNKRIIREKTATALGQIGDSGAVPALISALKHRDWATRWKSARALGMIKDRRGVEPLIAVLDDAKPEVRFTAAWALGELGDPRTIKHLTPLLKDAHVTVKLKAEEALKKISGKAEKE